MLVQLLVLQAPPHSIPALCQSIKRDYLPKMRRLTGFVSAHLIAHIDHQDEAQLIIYWESMEHMQAAQQGVITGLPPIAGLHIREKTSFLARA